MMQGGSKLSPHLRNIFHVNENEPEWRDTLKTFDNHVPRFADKTSCVNFLKKHCLRESNPAEPGLQHSVTTLTDWDQIEKYLLPKMLEYNKKYPVKPMDTDSFYEKNIYFRKNKKNEGAPSSSSSSSSSGADDGPQEAQEGLNPAGAAAVGDYVTSRLNLSIHHEMNYQSSLNTLKYMFYHLRCGIYVMVRGGEVVIFAPFVNKHYTNNWGLGFKMVSDQGGDSAAHPITNRYESRAAVERYYDQKEALFGYQKDNYLPDTAEWWANGNIICNQHTSLEDKNKHEAAAAAKSKGGNKRKGVSFGVDSTTDAAASVGEGHGDGSGDASSQWWGDSFLLQIKDMIAETCRCREVSVVYVL